MTKKTIIPISVGLVTYALLSLFHKGYLPILYFGIEHKGWRNVAGASAIMVTVITISLLITFIKRRCGGSK